MTDSVDALVIGAGPAGSASAALLAEAGWRVLAVDRASFPREKPCSEYMSPEAVRMLDRLGVTAALRSAGAVTLSGSSVTAARGARLVGRFPEGRGLSIARRELDHALVGAARARGVEVREGTSLERLEMEGNRVTGAVLRSRDGEVRHVRASLTIGADGLRSRVARALGGQHLGWPARVAFVAHVAGVPGMADRAEMHVSGQGYVGLNAIGGGVTNVALVVPQHRAAHAAGRVDAYFMDELDRFPGVRGRVQAPCIVREVLVTGPFAARARRVTAPGALLVGDAADFFDPFTGEGICAALTGAALVAQALGPVRGRDAAVDRALAAYRHARWRRFAGKWAVERLIGYSMMVPGLFDHAVARIGRRHGMADTLVGVTGAVLPARAVLNPFFLARMVL
jgi:2-polyprenyl-6-methoxyphenol hydroxylase-like FAD-dependent oxidoreductase